MSDEAHEDDTLDTPTDSSPEGNGSEPAVDENAESSPAKADGAKDSPAPRAKSEREQLVEQLSTGKDPNAVPTPEPSAEADEHVDDAPGAVSDEPAGDDAEDEDAKREKALTAPLPDDAKPATKQRFAELIEDRKRLLPHANFGQQIAGYLDKTKLTPQAFGEWLEFGAETYRDPKQAAFVLLAQAQATAKAQGVELPTETQTIAGLTPERLSEFDGQLLELVSSGDITGETAKKLREWATKQKAEAPAPKAPAAPVQQQQRQPAERETQTADQTQYTELVKKADSEIRKLDAEYAKALPADWAKIRPAIIKSMRENYKGTNPERWPQFFKREVELARAKFSSQRPAQPKSTTLRATTTMTDKPADDKITRKSLVAELTGKRS